MSNLDAKIRRAAEDLPPHLQDAGLDLLTDPDPTLTDEMRLSVLRKLKPANGTPYRPLPHSKSQRMSNFAARLADSSGELSATPQVIDRLQARIERLLREQLRAARGLSVEDAVLYVRSSLGAV